MNWNWDNFRFFLALADNQTLIAAASELGVSHTTVLRRIKAFESQLGTQLFTHSAEGYRLTEKGVELREHASTLKSSVDSIARTVVGANRQVAGKITVTTTDTVGYMLMPDLLVRLYKKYPALQVELLIQNNFTNIKNLEAEVAIRTGPNPQPDLIGRKLGVFRFCLCASKNYLKKFPVTGPWRNPVQGDEHRFIVLSDAYQQSGFQQWYKKQLPENYSATVADGFMSAYKMCCSGLGITVLPEYLVSGDERLVRVESETSAPENDIWVLSHEDLRNSATVKAFKDFLAAELKPMFNSG